MKARVLPKSEIALSLVGNSIHSVHSPYYGYDSLKEFKSRLVNPVEVSS